MTLFETFRAAHILAGVAVLISFWAAAAASKGGTTHRRFGRIYQVAMAALLSATLVMTVSMVTGGQVMRAVFNVYVALISVASVWMSWRSIADKADVDAYRGLVCKGLCLALGVYGIFLLTMVPRMDQPARMALAFAFAVLGLTISAMLLRRIVLGADHPRWWLSEHLTGMALNFGATHASFSILGLGALFPFVKEPWNRTAIVVSWMLAALVVRLWAGRRFMGARPARPAETALATIRTAAGTPG